MVCQTPNVNIDSVRTQNSMYYFLCRHLGLVRATMIWVDHPHSKVHGANMRPIWGRQDPGGSHVGPMNFAIWAAYASRFPSLKRCKAISNHHAELLVTNKLHELYCTMQVSCYSYYTNYTQEYVSTYYCVYHGAWASERPYHSLTHWSQLTHIHQKLDHHWFR